MHNLQLKQGRNEVVERMQGYHWCNTTLKPVADGMLDNRYEAMIYEFDSCGFRLK
jgi:hypothetical protein